jgi:RND family efflux transporter MFP subunit
VELERSVLRAPFDGLVTQRFVNPGERVSAGDLIVRVVGQTRLEVVARATIENVRFMYPGAPVGISDVTGREGTGRVRTIVPLGDSSQPMYELRIDVAADDWIVAQAVELSVPVAAPAELLTVPRDALVLRRDGTYVMRIDDEARAERIEVKTGLSDGALIAVSGELEPGDLVVVRGAERLQPGQQVRVLEDESASPAAEVSRND